MTDTATCIAALHAALTPLPVNRAPLTSAKAMVELVLSAPRGTRLCTLATLAELQTLHQAFSGKQLAQGLQEFKTFGLACQRLPARQRLRPFGRRVWI